MNQKISHLKRSVLFLLLLLGSGSLWAQTNGEHTVQSGETLFSISKKYGISVKDLREANPGIGMLFKGLKLVIPAQNTLFLTEEETVTTGTGQPADAPHEVSVENTEKEPSPNPGSGQENGFTAKDETAKDYSRMELATKLAAVYFDPKDDPKGTISSSVRTYFMFGADYCINKNFFIELLGGYDFLIDDSKVEISKDYTYKTKTTSHFFTTVQYVGLRLPFTEESGLSFYAGPDESMMLSRRTKVDGEKDKNKYNGNRFSADFTFGIRFSIGGGCLGMEYKHGLGDDGAGFIGFYLGASF